MNLIFETKRVEKWTWHWPTLLTTCTGIEIVIMPVIKGFLNDTKSRAKDLGDLTTPEAHEHVLCSALKFNHYYKALTLEKM